MPIDRCKCKVEKFKCCGNIKKAWIHQDHVLSGDDDDDTSLCAGGYETFETEVQGRCCTAACCRRHIEDSEDFKQQKQVESELGFVPIGPNDARVDWKDQQFLRGLEKLLEFEWEKEWRLKREARAAKWKLFNVGVQKLKVEHEKRCRPLQSE